MFLGVTGLAALARRGADVFRLPPKSKPLLVLAYDRTVLWIHLPDAPPPALAIDVPTVHMDIVSTLFNTLGFDEDVRYTQGRSLLGHVEYPPMLSLCEHLSKPPRYRALVTHTYISRCYTASRYLFSGVQRRDGAAVEGEWLREARTLRKRQLRCVRFYPTFPVYRLSPKRKCRSSPDLER